MPVDKLKLTHIITSLSAGGAQVLLYELIKSSDLDRYHVEVICLGRKGSMAQKIEALGLPVHYLNVNKFFLVISFYRLYRHLKQTKPDIVQTWLYHANLLGGLAAKLARVKQIIWGIHHSVKSDLKYSTYLVLKLGAWFSSIVPNRIVYSAEQAKLNHEHYGYDPFNSIVITNGIDTQRYVFDGQLRQENRCKLTLSDEDFVVGMFARFHPQKGFYTLMQAFKEFKGQQKAKLLLAGEHVDAGNALVQTWIKELGLDSDVLLLGEISTEQYMSVLDAYVLASEHSETSPLILLEAMSSQIPVIAADVGDCKKIVADKGLIVSPKSPMAIKNALIALASLTPHQRAEMGSELRERAVKNYSLEQMLKNYTDLYQPTKVALIIGSSVFTLAHFRLELMQQIQAKGYEVVACSPVENNELVSRITEKGIRFLPIWHKHASINPFSHFSTYFAIAQIIKTYKPEYVLSYTLKLVVIGSYLAKRYNTPFIASMITGLGFVYSGESFKQRLLQFLLNRMLKHTLSCNKAVIFQNPDDAKQFMDQDIVEAGKVSVVNGSGINIEEYKPLPYPESCSFILVSRLLHEKGISEYVEAAKVIKLKYPYVKFYLVGKHYQSPSSIDKVELNVWIQSGVIDYLGELNDIKPAIAQASVFVLPTYYREGTPRAILEAMAMARPVITTDMPGCRETVANGENGYLIPPKNTQALIEAMQNFIERPEWIVLMGSASRKLAESKYDVRLINTAILQALKME